MISYKEIPELVIPKLVEIPFLKGGKLKIINGHLFF